VAKTFTIILLGSPGQSSNATTAMRIIDAALRRGVAVDVVTFAGAAGYAASAWAGALGRQAEQSGVQLRWSSAASDLPSRLASADNTLVVPIR
jgi:hypothetical protein